MDQLFELLAETLAPRTSRLPSPELKPIMRLGAWVGRAGPQGTDFVSGGSYVAFKEEKPQRYSSPFAYIQHWLPIANRLREGILRTCEVLVAGSNIIRTLIERD